MVAPSPDLGMRIVNTEHFIRIGQSHLIRQYSQIYPTYILDIPVRNNLMVKKPWIEPFVKDKKIPKKDKQSSLQNNDTSLEPVITSSGDKVLVLCVDFSDNVANIPISTIYDRYFGDIGNTFKNYFKENSYGLYIPEGRVHGWYRAPQTYAYYKDDPVTPGPDYGMGSYPHNTQRLFEDVLNIVASDPEVDLSYIDADNDNKINRVMIVHAGDEAAAGYDDIWAHKWSINPKLIGGKGFHDYAMSAEHIYGITSYQRSGVDCHEYAHILNLPDLYDYSGVTIGVGYWSLMGHGSWGDYARTPTHLDAWSKKELGWITPSIDSSGELTLRNTESYQDCLLYTTSDPKEYFLVENRQRTLFDYYLPGSGLLIWHINENKNQYSDPSCHTVSLIQADNLHDLETKQNYGDDADPYPGYMNNISWGRYALPNSELCLKSGQTYPDILNISIDSIFPSSYTMTCTVTLPIPVTCNNPILEMIIE